MVIPREKGLVRLYIQLLSIKPDVNSGRADRSQITPSSILAAAQKILAPYTLTYKYCDWWTAYQIGQRLGTDFHHRNRVFLAGDAVHTHSPKAGQGMNVSMQDSYNLGWKIGLVVKGIAKPEILATYEDERRKIAKDLIDFDHKFSRLFSGRPAKDVLDETGVSMQEFKEVFLKGNLFASGVAVEYDNSMLVAKKGRKDDEIYNDNAIATSPAKNITLGARLSPTKILNQASALPTPILTLLKSDSRFRILIFAGNIISPLQSHRLYGFCHKLTESTFMAPYLHSAVAVLTCHSAERTDVELLRDFPDVCRPFSEDMGFEYNSVFVDGGEVERQGGTGGVDTFSPSGTPSRAHGTAYEKYGIDRETGCIVITRPDQYVGYVGVLDGEEGWREVEGYFRGVLVDRERSSRREDYEIRGGDDDRSYDDEDDVSDDDGMMSDDDKIINSDDDQRIGEDDDGTTDIRVAAGSSRRW
jgi:phenol 2-monooxygenase